MWVRSTLCDRHKALPGWLSSVLIALSALLSKGLPKESFFFLFLVGAYQLSGKSYIVVEICYIFDSNYDLIL